MTRDVFPNDGFNRLLRRFQSSPDNVDCRQEFYRWLERHVIDSRQRLEKALLLFESLHFDFHAVDQEFLRMHGVYDDGTGLRLEAQHLKFFEEELVEHMMFKHPSDKLFVRRLLDARDVEVSENVFCLGDLQLGERVLQHAHFVRENGEHGIYWVFVWTDVNGDRQEISIEDSYEIDFLNQWTATLNKIRPEMLEFMEAEAIFLHADNAVVFREGVRYEWTLEEDGEGEDIREQLQVFVDGDRQHDLHIDDLERLLEIIVRGPVSDRLRSTILEKGVVHRIHGHEHQPSEGTAMLVNGGTVVTLDTHSEGIFYSHRVYSSEGEVLAQGVVTLLEGADDFVRAAALLSEIHALNPQRGPDFSFFYEHGLPVPADVLTFVDHSEYEDPVFLGREEMGDECISPESDYDLEDSFDYRADEFEAEEGEDEFGKDDESEYNEDDEFRYVGDDIDPDFC